MLNFVIILAHFFIFTNFMFLFFLYTKPFIKYYINLPRYVTGTLFDHAQA